VDENVTARMLKRWLSAVNMIEFRAQNSMYHYVNLFGVHSLLIIHQETPTDENLGKDIVVPS
jgi:hypothetical protein